MRIEEIEIDRIYYVYDDRGVFICSADTKKEAEREIEEYLASLKITVQEYVVTCLRAKARWITKNGQRLQVPSESFNHFKEKTCAKSAYEAIRNVQQSNYIYVDIDVIAV